MRTLIKRVMKILYPELRSFPESEQAKALQHAKETPFDVLELLGMATGVVVVTALTNYDVDSASLGARLFRGINNFLIAIPLLVIAIGPFFVRRTRRGLRADLQQRRVRANHNVKE